MLQGHDPNTSDHSQPSPENDDSPDALAIAAICGMIGTCLWGWEAGMTIFTAVLTTLDSRR